MHNRRVFDVQLGERIYVRGSDGMRQAQSLQVYTMTSTGIAGIVAFSDPGLFAAFGLPTTWSG